MTEKEKVDDRKETTVETKLTIEDRVKRLEQAFMQLVQNLQSQQPQQSTVPQNPYQYQSKVDPQALALLSTFLRQEQPSENDPFRKIGMMAVNSFMRTIIKKKIKHV